MKTSRRNFIKSTLAGTLCIALPRVECGSSQPARELPRPDPSLFNSGDFVWPKKPGAYVPYNSGSTNTPEQDRAQWLQDKKAYLVKHKKVASTDLILRRRIESLQNMDYREFIAVYEGNQTPGIPGLYSGGSFYVGHVGIIEVDQDQKAWVIEALLGKEKRVVKRSYEDWIKGRSDEVVWLGRLRDLPSEARAKVAEEATKYIDRPYDFWNFDLDDDSAFYCSKLAWLSIFRALKFPVDGNQEPNRAFWFSPKQLMHSPAIELLHNPGAYATK
jgi:hypothetical protein